MKKLSLFFVSFAIASIFTGCVGPRTAHIGKNYLMATNLTGTVSSQQVGNEPPVTYAQTNFTVTSIPPVERTWREVVTGKRPPSATSPLVTPLMPNAGIYGVTPMMSGAEPTAPQVAPQQQAPQGTSSGTTGSYGRTPSGAPVLLGNRPYQGTPRLLPSRRVNAGGVPAGPFAQVGGGLRSFLLPTVYGGGSGNSFTSVRWVSGQVSFPETRFERTALAHDTLIHGGMPRNTRLRNGERVNSLNATVAVGGSGQFRSGLVATGR